MLVTLRGSRVKRNQVSKDRVKNPSFYIFILLTSLGFYF